MNESMNTYVNVYIYLCIGTVPIYLGDAEHLRALLPHPKAAIFIADYNNDYKKLADYLNYLSTNETAYEEHREWRKDFTYEKNIKNKPLLQNSWYCNVCRWSLSNSKLYSNKQKLMRKCSSNFILDDKKNNLNLKLNINNTNTKVLGNTHIKDYFEVDLKNNRRVVKGPNEDIYLIRNKTLHLIPNIKTFHTLNIDINSIRNVGKSQLKRYRMGVPLIASV